MTVISSREFVANQNKYFDMALNEDVCIKRGEDMFRLMYNFIDKTDVKKRVYYSPDEDFYRSISMEELRASVHEHIHKLFAKK